MDEKYIEQPRNLKKNLYPHQLRNVYRMELLEKDKKIVFDDPEKRQRTLVETILGILSDETGYGKTICIVALILRDKMPWNIDSDYIQKRMTDNIPGYTTIHDFFPYNTINCTLILAGPSIIGQWEEEFAYTDLKVACIKGKKQANQTRASDYDVILVIPNQIKEFLSRYTGVAWKRFVYDEPGHNHVPRMKKIIAGFTWLITATPRAIREVYRGRQGFLQDITRTCPFNAICPYIEIRNTHEQLIASFDMPPTEHVYHMCRNNIFKALNGFVNGNISNLIKAGNIGAAIHALGGKQATNISDLIELALVKKRAELEDVQYHFRKWEERKDEEKALLWRNRKENVLNQIKELENRVHSMIEGFCPICFESLTKPVMEPECKTIFCGKCLFEWLKGQKNCPTCRAHINPKNLVYISQEEKKEKEPLPTKTEMMIQLIRNHPKNKFIIYSSCEDSFQGIRLALTDLNISFIEVSGTADQRAKKLEKFHNEVNVAFLNSRQDSAGINMQETTDIILYHEMTPATLQQIIGRANRIGRKGGVTVHHLEVEN